MFVGGSENKITKPVGVLHQRDTETSLIGCSVNYRISSGAGSRKKYARARPAVLVYL